MITSSSYSLTNSTIICDLHKCSAPVLHTKISLRYSTNHRAAHISLCVLWRKPYLPSLPTRATGSSALRYGWSAMVPRSRLSPYTCTGSSARCYGIRASQGQEPSNKLTARTLLIPRINALGLTTRLFFTVNASKLPKHAYDVYLQHLYTNVCLGLHASNSLSSCPI